MMHGQDTDDLSFFTQVAHQVPSRRDLMGDRGSHRGSRPPLRAFTPVTFEHADAVTRSSDAAISSKIPPRKHCADPLPDG